MLSLSSFIPSNSFTNAAFTIVFYVALPAFLFLYLIRSYPRISKIYLAVAYYACVLGRFAATKFVFWILKWVFTQILRGCKALAWFGFYVHFFVAGMNFVLQGYNSSLDFLAGFGKAMEEAQEEREREAEARKREERARAAHPANSAGDEQKPKDSHKKSKRKR
ncbi:hypothetical protein E1B28_006241 [Marasmius oreades]|uniref:Uncharacterized protein n=1 Tax=Marasmius oreades TaxID=181124 RepID=A0A9P7S537_9AGAR|nr:uncharacterized protein E1B28_006241 [Marasmius oreades]KAG7095502.1 hypothetical protein E1B28_006241 [Marasmius oreades]